MMMQKHHPLIRQALTYFDTIYNVTGWSCGTVYLTKAYTELFDVQQKFVDVQVRSYIWTIQFLNAVQVPDSLFSDSS